MEARQLSLRTTIEIQLRSLGHSSQAKMALSTGFVLLLADSLPNCWNLWGWTICCPSAAVETDIYIHPVNVPYRFIPVTQSLHSWKVLRLGMKRVGKLSIREILESLQDSRKVLDCLELCCPAELSATMGPFCLPWPVHRWLLSPQRLLVWLRTWIFYFIQV